MQVLAVGVASRITGVNSDVNYLSCKMALKELEVIAHAIACRGRGFPYYRCQLPSSITCRVK